MKKGALVSVEGRFTSSSFQGTDGQMVYRNEITADRVEGLESRAQSESRGASVQTPKPSNKPMQFEAQEEKQESQEDTKDVP